MTTKTNNKFKTPLAFGVVVLGLAAVFYWSVLSGGLKIGPVQLLRGLFLAYDKDVAIVYDLRFPRILIAMLGGGIMAVSGVLLQAVMRNPLAEPGIIGISSGAAFAAALTAAFAPSLSVLTPVFSFAGGMCAFCLVYVLAWNKGLSPLRIILVGIAVNTLFSGLSAAFGAMTGGRFTGAEAIVNANIQLKSWADVKVLAVYTLLGLVLCVFAVRHCNLLALSDETVGALGVNVNRARILISVLSVLLASVFTSIVGPVSFLGLIVPHIGRLLVGSDHKRLLPFSFLAGALVFLTADTIGRTVAYPYEINASILMAVIGGPVLIILLRRSRRLYGI